MIFHTKKSNLELMYIKYQSTYISETIMYFFLIQLYGYW